MIAALLALTLQQTPQFKDIENHFVRLRYVGTFEAKVGMPTFSPDLTAYSVSQVFEPYKGPPLNDLADTPPISFTLKQQGKPGWSFTSPSRNDVIRVLADSSVAFAYHYVRFEGFTVLDAKSGAKLWSRRAAKPSRTNIQLEGGVVYQWLDGRMTASNERTGEIIWDQPLPSKSSEVEMSPIRLSQGRLYIDLLVGKVVELVCLDAKSGQEKWRKQTGYPLTGGGPSLPGVKIVGNQLFGFKYEKKKVNDWPVQWIFALDAITGDNQWERKVDFTAAPFWPSVNEKAIVAGCVRRPWYTYRLSDGRQMAKLDCAWGFQLGGYVVSIDDTSGFVIQSSATGERLGRVKLPPGYWMLREESGHVLVESLLDGYPARVAVYDATAFGG